ncbi:MAG: LPS-assembly protein LptD [Prevotellaceae bacterium]|nr:LPS-assembly protein LptD [Prevotellaceae bacterium]
MVVNIRKYLAITCFALTASVGYAQVEADSASLIVPVAADTTALASRDSTGFAPDSTGFAPDSLLAVSDSAAVDSTISPDAITDPILSNGRDSTVYQLVGGSHVLIYGDGKVTFQDMEITADYIDFDLVTKVAYARGTYDSASHEVKGKPVLKQGSETYEMDSMYFNIKSKKAKIYAVITQQSEGYLHGKAIKRMPDGVIYVQGGTYTTCDAPHPHFGFELTKAKVVPGKQVITGPMYFMLEDVTFPPPILLPFGMFPQSSSRSSGVIIPSYGEETSRGFYFREGGYYFAFSDYFDVTLTGDYYTLGSWAARMRSSYVWRYHFSGSFSGSYASNVSGEKGSADFNDARAFSLQWTHTQDPKFSPNKTFAASVNFATSEYRRNNELTLSESLTNTTQSSISYSQTWPGTPFSMSFAATHSHNTRDSIITLGLPTLTVNMARITPFKRKERVGPIKWYENIGIPLSLSAQNTITAKETDFDLGDSDFFKRKMRNGARYSTSMSVPFTVAKFINLTPSISYNGRIYASQVEQTWVDTTFGYQGYIRRDTNYGVFVNDFDFSTSASASTMIYGMYSLGSWSPVMAVRHVVTPSISLGWRPDFSTEAWGIYHDMYSEANAIRAATHGGKADTVRHQMYSPNQSNIYGTAGSGKNMSMSFGLGNTLEMKVRDKSDTTGVGSKKIKLLEGFNLSGSYNFLADSMKLSTIGFSGRTTLPGNIGISFNGTLDPYALDDNGRRIAAWNYTRTSQLVRLTSFGFSFGYSFNRSEKMTNSLPHPVVNDLDPMGQYDGHEVSYVDFTLPWTFSFSYSFHYTKPQFTPIITQTLNFNGSFSLTPKWAFTFSSGYDLALRKISPTNVSLNRDLHCWTMAFSWIPIGSWKSWNFTINVKSAMLHDLKYDRRQSRYDQEPIK